MKLNNAQWNNDIKEAQRISDTWRASIANLVRRIYCNSDMVRNIPWRKEIEVMLEGTENEKRTQRKLWIELEITYPPFAPFCYKTFVVIAVVWNDVPVGSVYSSPVEASKKPAQPGNRALKKLRLREDIKLFNAQVEIHWSPRIRSRKIK